MNAFMNFMRGYVAARVWLARHEAAAARAGGVVKLAGNVPTTKPGNHQDRRTTK